MIFWKSSPLRLTLGLSLAMAITGCGGDTASEDSSIDTSPEAPAAEVKAADNGEEISAEPVDEVSGSRPASKPAKPIAKLEVPELPNRLFVEYQIRKEQYADETPKRQFRVKIYSDGSQVNDGEFVEWYPNGQKWKEGAFVDGRENGEWTFWHENGQIAKQPNYVDGQLDGSWTLYREDGSPVEKRSYRAGKRHGEFVTYDPSGKQQISLQKFESGAPHGVWTTWYPDGEKKEEAEFLDGQLHGAKRQWHPDGKLAAEEEYRVGRLHGVQKQWDNEGKLLSSREFKDGQPVP